MPDPAFAAARFKLPTRIRSRMRNGAENKSRMDLIDRIADLQGIRLAEHDDEAAPRRVNVYLETARCVSRNRHDEISLLCSLGREGIAVYGLDRWARHQVLARSWGGLNRDSVLVYPPRDSNELEAVWQIVRRAYDNRQSAPEKEDGTQVISTWDVPKFSRTSLQ